MIKLNLYRIVIVFALFVSSLCAEYAKTTDSKNVYYSSTYFKVIAGISYSNDTTIQTMAYNILDEVEEARVVLIDKYAFSKPKNSDTKKIDIYIGDRNAYDYINGIYVTIGSDFGGWSNYYPDGTPHFVLNPTLGNDARKVTIAHEFFHTIQYAYFDINNISDDKWRRNIWWLEASAMMAEDEVYDDINQYIPFMDPFFVTSYKSIEIFDGSHEYAMVVFAKFIKEKFGIEFFKKTYPLIVDNKFAGYFEIIDSLLQTEYHSSIKLALSEFALWVANPSKYFEEGSLYPRVSRYSNFQTIEKGGILILQNSPNYFVGDSDTYCMQLSSNRKNVLSDSNDEIVISNFSSSSISQNIFDANKATITDMTSSSTQSFTNMQIQTQVDNSKNANISRTVNNQKQTIANFSNIDSVKVYENKSKVYIETKITNMAQSLKFNKLIK